MDNLLSLLALAGCNFVIAVPGGDDIMLNYQSTSYHDSIYIRNLTKCRPSPEFETWLEQIGITRSNKLLRYLAKTTFKKILLESENYKKLDHV